LTQDDSQRTAAAAFLHPRFLIVAGRISASRCWTFFAATGTFRGEDRHPVGPIARGCYGVLAFSSSARHLAASSLFPVAS
jgi:hypothetical protein